MCLVTQKQHKLHREDTQSILATKLSEKKPEALIDIMQATDSRRKSRIDVKSESKVESRISKLKFVSGPVCIRTKISFMLTLSRGYVYLTIRYSTKE